MNYEEFIGEIQHRIRQGTQREAVRTARSVLETLGERLTEGEATDLASPLPMEIDRYLIQVENKTNTIEMSLSIGLSQNELQRYFSVKSVFKARRN